MAKALQQIDDEFSVIISTKVPSHPPAGCHKVTNVYVDADGVLIYEYEA